MLPSRATLTLLPRVDFHVRGLKRPQIRDIYPLQFEFYQGNLTKKKPVFYPLECVFFFFFYWRPPSKRHWASFELQLGGFCCEILATLGGSILLYCSLQFLPFITNRSELYLYSYSLCYHHKHHSLLQCLLSRPEYCMLVILALLMRKENV